jgi:ribosomal protein S12 methylthiotransferase accessory factor
MWLPSRSPTGQPLPSDIPVERTVSAEETVARIRPFFRNLGITRLSRQTDLDRVGIPCWATFRPNAASLSTNQGKGLSDAAAQASAVMEALEFAVAEQPEVDVRNTSVEELRRAHERYFSPNKLLPADDPLDVGRCIDWVPAYHLITGLPVWVPLDIANLTIEGTQLRGICKTTNGLASGNTLQEAVLHGVLELVERDATTLWSLMPAGEQLARAMSLEPLTDPALAKVVASIEDAGLSYRVFDVTTDLDIPSMVAVVGPAQSQGRFEVCAGHACHPDPVRAVIRALLEAVQGRITAIAAARDDIVIDEFGRSTSDWDNELLPATLVRDGPVHAGSWNLASLMSWTKGHLQSAGIDPIVVPLGGAQYGVAVVKVVSDVLEDRDPNLNWRPGPRAIRTLASLP